MPAVWLAPLACYPACRVAAGRAKPVRPATGSGPRYDRAAVTIALRGAVRRSDAVMSASFPAARARRLRRSPAMRRLVAQVAVRPADLILPMFVKEGISEPQPIGSMPGVLQHTRDSLRKAAVDAVGAGVGGLILFGIPAVKDGRGSAADDPAGIVQLALRDVNAEVGNATVVMSDLCLDEYTDHGHCGMLTASGEVDNDATLARYAAIAVAQAAAGAQVVAPSGMMDGQVAAIRGPRGLSDGSTRLRRGAARSPARHRRRCGRRHGQAGACLPRYRPQGRGQRARAGRRVPGERRIRDGRGGRREWL